jgi:hypothetical protein
VSTLVVSDGATIAGDVEIATAVTSGDAAIVAAAVRVLNASVCVVVGVVRPVATVRAQAVAADRAAPAVNTSEAVAVP